MFFVVLYHSCLFWANKGWFIGNPVQDSLLLKHFSLWLNKFHIQGFTLVAGYIFYYIRFETKGYACLRSFLNKKIERLLMPYAFVSVFWVIPISVYFFDYSFIDFVKRFGLAIAPSQLWFLWMLFDVFIMAFTLSDWMHRNDKLSFCFAFGLMALGMICIRVIPNIFCLWTGLCYFIYFLIGFKFRQYGCGLICKIRSIYLVIIHLLFYCFTVYIHEYGGILYKLLYVGLSLVTQIIGSVMAFVVLGKIANYVDWKSSSLFKTFTSKSMSIYLLHQQIIYFTIYWFNGIVNPYINVVINFVVAIIGSYIIAETMFKFKVLRILMGEKG